MRIGRRGDRDRIDVRERERFVERRQCQRHLQPLRAPRGSLLVDTDEREHVEAGAAQRRNMHTTTKAGPHDGNTDHQ